MGGSYGGYMTAWITAHDHRFSAAIVERGFLDPVSALGSSDIGWFFTPQYFGGDPDHVRTQSPLHVADRVRTPTLVIHSEDDLRCPIEHAQRYAQALWASGVEAELLVFPGEDHELSRSGTPWHRRARFEHILRWWDRHLPVGPGAAAHG
jgi:dipeptidyl aminopeptidase/acylaminoacyl peptidase